MCGALSSSGVKYASPKSISVAIQAAPSCATKTFSNFRSARTVQVQCAARWAHLKAIALACKSVSSNHLFCQPYMEVT